MTIDEALVLAMAAKPDGTFPVPGIADRFYVMNAPQNSIAPYCVFFIVAQSPLESHGDPFLSLAQFQMQFSFFGPAYGDVRIAARTFMDYMIGNVGLGIVPYRGNGISAVLFKGITPIWEDDSKYHHIPVELDIMGYLQ